MERELELKPDEIIDSEIVEEIVEDINEVVEDIQEDIIDEQLAEIDMLASMKPKRDKNAEIVAKRKAMLRKAQEERRRMDAQIRQNKAILDESNHSYGVEHKIENKPIFEAENYEKTSSTLRNENLRDEELRYEEDLRKEEQKIFVADLQRQSKERNEAFEKQKSVGSHGIDFSGKEQHAVYQEPIEPDTYTQRYMAAMELRHAEERKVAHRENVEAAMQKEPEHIPSSRLKYAHYDAPKMDEPKQGSNIHYASAVIHKSENYSYHHEMERREQEVKRDNTGNIYINPYANTHKSPVVRTASFTPVGTEQQKMVNVGHDIVSDEPRISLNLTKGNQTTNAYARRVINQPHKPYQEVSPDTVPLGASVVMSPAGYVNRKIGLDTHKTYREDTIKTKTVSTLENFDRITRQQEITRTFATRLSLPIAYVGQGLINTFREDDTGNMMYSGYTYGRGAYGAAQAIRLTAIQSEGKQALGTLKKIDEEITSLRKLHGPLSLQQKERLDFLTNIETRCKDASIFNMMQYNEALQKFGKMGNMRIADIQKKINLLQSLNTLSPKNKEELAKLTELLKLKQRGKVIQQGMLGRQRIGNLVNRTIRKFTSNDDTVGFLVDAGSIPFNPTVRKVTKKTFDLASKTTKAFVNGGKASAVEKVVSRGTASAVKKTGTTLKKVNKTFKYAGKNVTLKRVTVKKVTRRTLKKAVVKKGAGTVVKKFSLGAMKNLVKQLIQKLISMASKTKVGLIVIGCIIALLLILCISVMISSAGAGASGSMICDDVEKIQEYVDILGDKQDKFEDELKKAQNKVNKLGNKYDNVTLEYLNGTVTNNTREILSMMAVRFGQDFSNYSEVKDYITQLFDDSHSINTRESAFYSCSGCKTRNYLCTDALDDFASSERIDLYNKYASRGGCKIDYDKSGTFDYLPPDCKDYEKEEYTKVIASISGIPKQEENTLYLWWDVNYECSNGYIGAWKFYLDDGSTKYVRGSDSFNPDTLGTTILTLNWYQGKYCITEDAVRYHCTYYKCDGHSEIYCDNTHQDLKIQITCLSFDSIFWQDSSVKGTGKVVQGDRIGGFKTVAYCGCCVCSHPYDKECTGSFTTAFCAEAKAGRTIAVDSNIIPIGSHVIINGKEYVAEDVRGNTKGPVIAVYVNSHSEVEKWGSKGYDVYWANVENKATTTDEWVGWTSDNIEWCKNIYNQDWNDFYEGVDFGDMGTLSSTGKVLTQQEISQLLASLPDDLSEERKAIVKVAAEAVGRIPYYWGGTATAPGLVDNKFGTVVKPDMSGRTLKGLDCSHFVDWVHWTAIGNNLGNGNTTTLWNQSKEIKKQDLKIGDLGFMSVGGSAENHVGIYVGNDTWIHCTGTPKNNVVMDNTKSLIYFRRLNIME